MAKVLIGRLILTVYSDDQGRIEIRSSRELENEFEMQAKLLSEHERSIVKDATDNAATLAGKLLRYIAFPDKRIITNRGLGKR